MKTRIIRFTLIFLLAITSIVGYASAENAKYGGVLRVGLDNEPTDLSPFRHGGVDADRIKSVVYNSLLMFDEQGVLQPALAESWEMPDEKTYILHIRKDAKFHNGQPVTAEDVKFTIETIMDPNTGAYLYSNFDSSLEKVTVINEKTIEIVLKSINVEFISLLGSNFTAIVSKDWVEAGHDLRNEMMGTGSFKFAEWDPGVKFTFVRNDNYWREGLPYLDRIEFIPIVDADVRTNALIAGQVDLIDLTPWKDWERIESYPNLTISKCPGFVMVLFFNPNFKPFANPKVRQAIKYAIDDNLIIKIAFYGNAKPSGGGLLLNSGQWAMPEEYQNVFYYDPDKARDLLAEAGYPNGFKVKLNASKYDIMHAQTAQVVQDQLAKVGIDVELDLIDWGAIVEKRVKGTYDFMVYSSMLTTPDPGNLSLYLESSSGVMPKPIGYKDEIMDKLLELGRLASDFELRKKVYETVEMRYLEQYPFACLARREDGYSHSNKVKGFIVFPYGIQSPVLPFDGIWIEE